MIFLKFSLASLSSISLFRDRPLRLLLWSCPPHECIIKVSLFLSILLLGLPCLYVQFSLAFTLSMLQLLLLRDGLLQSLPVHLVFILLLCLLLVLLYLPLEYLLVKVLLLQAHLALLYLSGLVRRRCKRPKRGSCSPLILFKIFLCLLLLFDHLLIKRLHLELLEICDGLFLLGCPFPLFLHYFFEVVEVVVPASALLC